MAVEGTAVS
jgi:hypothetical protein